METSCIGDGLDMIFRSEIMIIPGNGREEAF